jgi:integrating conjugative element protein (TIGR03749 family)
MKRLSLLLILSLITSPVWAVMPVEWQKRPIKIPLHVGEQRLVHFPDHVLFGRPKSLTDKLDVSSLQGTLYLTALEEFEPTQVKVRLNDSGDVVLLDLVALQPNGQPFDEVLVSVPGSEAGANQSSMLLDGQSAPPDGNKQSANPSNGASAAAAENPLKGTPFEPSTDEVMSPEEMIQFAAREFYAPPRLRTTDPRMNRTSIDKDEDTTDLFIDTSYGIFDATPVAAWISPSGQYLTTIRLINTKPYAVNVNPFHLNMQFNYAAPQHIKLEQANVPGDTTMLYIITDRPFTESRYESPAPWRPAVDDTQDSAKTNFSRLESK